jgi:spore coat protein CotH
MPSPIRDELPLSRMPDRLEVDQFAVYLAMMELIGNFDDIDGPGNNAYLYYDPTARRFTVVPWDMNLAFVGMGTGVIRDFPADGQAPDGKDTSMRRAPSASGTPTTIDLPPPDGQEVPDGPVIIDGGMQPNPLVERFNAVGEFAALVDEQSSRLRADLYDSGAAAAVLARWVSVLESGASGMVDQATIRSESEEIAKHFAPPE